jgi:hypothetical protein
VSLKQGIGMHFDPVAYFAGLLVNDLRSLAYEGIEGKEVVILGSGPSIDEVDLSKIENSIVVALNSAFQIFNRCGQGNSYYWFCQDTKVMTELMPKIPNEIKKLVAPHRFNRFFKIKKHLGSSDRFLQPKITLKIKPDTKKHWGVPSWSPRPLLNAGPPFLHDPRDSKLTLFPSTVMLTAISLFGGLGAKKIYCMGFDLTPPSHEGKLISSHISQSYKNSGFSINSINFYLEGLLREIQIKNNEIFNCSPLTYDSVLPKDENFNK